MPKYIGARFMPDYVGAAPPVRKHFLFHNERNVRASISPFVMAGRVPAMTVGGSSALNQHRHGF